MKRNISFIIVIFIVLICEICFHEYNHQDSFWTNNFRILSWIIMGFWYYDNQKENFNRIQTVFLISMLLPIIVSLSSYLIPERQAIIINIYTNIGILMLWIYAFKRLGAIITLNDSNRTLTKVTPAFFIFPLLFYYFSLYQALTGVYVFIVLIYIVLFSYTGVLAAFLPFNEEKRLWITFGIMLLVFVNIINGYHTFLQKLSWAYPVLRTVTVISRCMMIYGMIRYVEKRSFSFAEDE